MNRVLLDQGLSPRAAAILRELGWDAVHVSEISLDTADDAEILSVARNTGRVCVTLDHDFHAHLALAGSDRPSVVLLRVQGLDAIAQAGLIERVWHHCRDVLLTGAAVSANARSIRIRQLPLR